MTRRASSVSRHSTRYAATHHMILRYLQYICLIALVVACGATASHAQPVLPDASSIDTTRSDTNNPATFDTLRSSTPTAIGDDSLRVSAHSEEDTVVNYSARDSMKLSVSRKLMRLYGDAEVT